MRVRQRCRCPGTLVGSVTDPEPLGAEVTGVPTTRQRALRAAADQLTPVQALAAVDQASARVLGAVTVAGAAAGGLGLLSASRLEHAGIGWAVPCVLTAAIGVALAVFATVPIRATLRPGDLSAVEWWFDHQIKRRIALIRWSARLLSIAVLTAALPPVVSALAANEPQVDVALVARGDTVTVRGWGTNLPETATLRVNVTRGPQSLARALVDPDPKGASRASLLVRAEPGQTVRVEVSARRESGVLEMRAATITVP